MDFLPSQLARDCFVAWRNARGEGLLPVLADFAPLGLPTSVLPWVLVHRFQADGTLVYGLAGEELTHWFGEIPKGKPVLGDVDEPERQKRIALVLESISSGRPFWYSGTLLLKNKEHIPIGRLCLPARDRSQQVLLIIYFVLREVAPPWPPALERGQVEWTQLVWCGESELTGMSDNRGHRRN
jgi:hypothetical protein